MPFHEEKASKTSLQVCNMLSFSNFQTGHHKNKQIIHFLTKHLKGSVRWEFDKRASGKVYPLLV